MDVTMLTQVVSTLGFPIVVCLGMAWYIVKVLHPTIAKMSDALNNNTLALTKLTERIESEKAA